MPLGYCFFLSRLFLVVLLLLSFFSGLYYSSMTLVTAKSVVVMHPIERQLLNIPVLLLLILFLMCLFSFSVSLFFFLFPLISFSFCSFAIHDDDDDDDLFSSMSVFSSVSRSLSHTEMCSTPKRILIIN